MSKLRDLVRARPARRNTRAWSRNSPTETANRGTQRSATVAQFLAEGLLFGLIVGLTLQVASWAGRLGKAAPVTVWDPIFFTCVATCTLIAMLTLSTARRQPCSEHQGEAGAVISTASVSLIIALVATEAVLHCSLLVASSQLVIAGTFSVAAILFERSWVAQFRRSQSLQWAFVSNEPRAPMSARSAVNVGEQHTHRSRERTMSTLMRRTGSSVYADTQVASSDIVALPQTESGEGSLGRHRVDDGLIEATTVDPSFGHVDWFSTELSSPGSSSRFPHRSTKRLLDVAVSLIALLVLSPVMLLLALLIKLESRGPALFIQARVGQHGKTFDLLKFRSMRVDAEYCTGPVFAKPNDPRCTRVGRLMRRHSLDELPQLINVLRGDMSIVGPRPERPYFVARFSQTVPRYVERHREKAGITGWAQVNGRRGDTSIEERVRYDLHYVEHWSLAFDLKIMVRTLIEILQGHNAY